MVLLEISISIGAWVLPVCTQVVIACLCPGTSVRVDSLIGPCDSQGTRIRTFSSSPKFQLASFGFAATSRSPTQPDLPPPVKAFTHLQLSSGIRFQPQ